MVMLPTQNAPARHKTVPVVWHESAWAVLVVFRSRSAMAAGHFWFPASLTREGSGFKFFAIGQSRRNESAQIKYIRFVHESRAKAQGRRKRACTARLQPLIGLASLPLRGSPNPRMRLHSLFKRPHTGI